MAIKISQNEGTPEEAGPVDPERIDEPEFFEEKYLFEINK